jgi:hypothetical protein
MPPVRKQPVSRRDRPAKPPLSRAGVIAVALRIMRDEGLEKVTMRRIAAELEGKVFQPVPWRTTVAFVGGGPDIVCDWHRHFTAQVTADAWGGVRSEDRTRLSQLVLLHEAPDEGCVTGQASLQGEGLVVDLASGQVARMTAKAIDPPGPKG